MEPIFIDPDLPRYSEDPFPPYRYLPFVGNQPHPRRDPAGHSFGREEEQLSAFSQEDWQNCRSYLYGVDLFNHGYWWEAHEAWETLWFAAGQQTKTGQFIQGLIQLAAAQLKRFCQEMRGARQLTQTGVAKLAVAEGNFLGIAIATFVADIEHCLQEDRGEFPRIRLVF